MSPPRGGDRFLVLCALLVALVLHLPAHLGFSGGVAGREALVEDGPVLVANPALDAWGAETLRDVVARAASDPAAAWGEGDGSVGRSRWRPVSQAAFAVEHGVFRGRTAQGAAVVSLLLHLGTVLLTLRLLDRLDAPRAARWIGALAVATSPAALSAAAWPARQAVVLATFAGVGAAVLAVRGGWLRHAGAAVLVFAAAASHEIGFGLGLGTMVLAACAPREDGGPRRPWLPAAAVIAALLARSAALDGAADVVAATGRVPGPLDGLVGIFHAAVSLLLPARLHFADGPWTASIAGHAVALVTVGVGGWLLVRRGGAASALALAAVATLLPLAAQGIGSAPAGAPYGDGALYAATVFGASAAGWAIAACIARGGAVRTAAIAAASLWIALSVAGTAERAPSFRTRDAHLRLAENEMPESAVVEAWSLAAAVSSAERAGADASAHLRQTAVRAAELARRVTAPDAPAYARDPVAAVTIATALSRTAVALARADIAPGDDAHEAAAVAADAATRLVPRWTRAWLVLAAAQERVGALQAAWDAASRAGETAPRDLEALATGVRMSLRIGNPKFAAFVAESLLDEEMSAAKTDGRKPRPETLLLYARAACADGGARVPDPFGGSGVRFRFEVAIAVLRDLIERGERVDEAREQLYRTCLLYGDLLASLDRTALALLAYQEAGRTAVRDPEAAEHLGWLAERLRAEERAAAEALERARRGEGNVADALVGLGRAFARQARWREAAEVFGQLERDLGMSPALRFLRATELLRETEPARAVEELRLVTKEDPSFARGHYELARLLEEAADYAAALEAYREARRLSVEQAATGGAEEWLLDADERFDALEQILREVGAAR